MILFIFANRNSHFYDTVSGVKEHHGARRYGDWSEETDDTAKWGKNRYKRLDLVENKRARTLLMEL